MFLWGTATASYQIEGAVAEDGRGPSVWDTFSHTPHKVRDGHTGDVACDHYHRYAEDVALMAGLGVDAYRFSIAWPRVLPTGRGRVNQAGLDFYDRLVDALHEKGITPVPTLFHWDLPQALEDEGGWLDRDTSRYFADYAAVVADRLADRVSMWITLNEPFVHMVYGYALGMHAPGRTLMLGALPTAHHQLLGHGLATQALRAAGARHVLITNNCTPVWPASGSEQDLAAAEAYDILHNRLFNDPVLTGAYPDLSAYGVELPVKTGDLETIAQPLDGLGVNYYMPTRISGPGGGDLPFEFEPISGHPVTAFGWPVVPGGLRELLGSLTARYGDALPPVYVTENGCSYDGLDDQERIAYLDGHIRAMREADADVRGYFVWSLLDNFEWAEGYHQRFGLVHVDFETLRRTPKASYHWFADFLKAQSTDT
ncbi:beta-glucosidase [Microbispora triticiradicis]|uniref:Beta-glucosidase n=3 Tax=Microbispora TaxID=2005 RepID=A0ABY3M0V1_9ACTN|nr:MULTISPECIES: GH1 family beta-glucosidase [Microbispora]RGA02424.1 beta-glucosidase [Microbispora triticiradicis]TLP52829.1 beta-glucosidase [Microbispora fusca]TYB62906.1 beta-glucosidase [Microbispora tritici]GLW24417.1 beta-glucosidase [Microbispora amethystogenes]